MKLILAFLLLISSATLMATPESEKGSCCFCMADSEDAKSTQLECKKWLKMNGKKLGCDYKKTFESYAQTDYPEDLTCRQAHIYGAFHGNSTYYYAPFRLVAKMLAKIPSVEKVTYDGSTCLVFNNIQEVEAEANSFAAKFPFIDALISGNQNLGIVFTVPLLLKPVESISNSSKMNLSIANGKAETTYAECSKFGKSCGYATTAYGRSATTDINEKICMHNNEVTTQRCCQEDYGDGTFGLWSKPGQGCDF